MMSKQPRRHSSQKPASRRRSLRSQPVHVPAGHFIIGKIAGVHGLRGEVKVELHTDFPERFAPGQSVLVGDRLDAMEITSVRPHKGVLLIGFHNIPDRTGAEALRGEWVYIAEENAMALEEDTYWVHDILGLAVQTVEGQKLGVVEDVIFTGANEVYVVKTEAGINHGRDLLLPAIDQVVQAVNLDTGLITVKLLPGMLEG